MQDKDWIERARSMVAYHAEALDFIRRAALPVLFDDADVRMLTRLWIEADDLDDMLMTHLSELNNSLIGGAGALDASRGVSQRPSAVSGLTDFPTEISAFFECSWSLVWADERAVIVTLELDVAAGVFHAYARGTKSSTEARIGYPITANSLQGALADTFVAEATAL